VRLGSLSNNHEISIQVQRLYSSTFDGNKQKGKSSNPKIVTDHFQDQLHSSNLFSSYFAQYRKSTAIKDPLLNVGIIFRRISPVFFKQTLYFASCNMAETTLEHLSTSIVGR